MTNNTLIALFTLPFFLNTEPSSAAKIHGMEDLKDDKEKRYFVTTVVKNTGKEEKNTHAEPEFPGKGYRLGGDSYVNRLLDIDHKLGKRLAKKHHHHHHHHDEVKDLDVNDMTLDENKENTSLIAKGNNKKNNFAKTIRKMYQNNFVFSALDPEMRG